MPRFDALFERYNAARRAADRLRELTAVTPAGRGRLRRNGRDVVDFSSNDYLGLSSHPLLIERAAEYGRVWGVGARASRLVCGTLALHEAIEAKLAALKGTEAALILTSGYQANATILPALCHKDLLGQEALVFTDELIHNSLVVGCRAAGIRPIRFRHNDLGHLEDLLREAAPRRAVRFIVTESVFSMDGDRADVAALAGLAEMFGAFLYLDEAHATGVLGPRGLGLSDEAPGQVPMIMGTFSKALGSLGAYVACSRPLRDYLVNRCGGFVYSTALPPPVLGAIDAALDLLPTLGMERTRLAAAGDRVRAGFRAAGIDTGKSTTQIIPALIGGEAATLRLSRALEAEGLLGIAIRPPTVPEGTSRIRFALSAVHEDAEIDRLVAAMTALTAAAVAS
ncbi:MAG: 8-amino-7-oxononanoate synthase [Rhodospirillales bacterium]|nr:8-amino-7-oxononanoate synthase [Rhodospirillales bacterium]